MRDILLNLIWLGAGGAGLYYGADFLVRGGVALAKKAGMPPLVIGLTLVAFATSAPELVVSVRAAVAGNADISLGNVMGSNICNIALILGLSACIRPIHVDRQLLKFDLPVMLAATILLGVFYLTGRGLNRLQGGVFFAGLILYVFWNIRSSRKNGSAGVSGEAAEALKVSLPLAAALFFTVLGFIFLVTGADIFLRGAVFFARLFNLSDAVIGLTIVAVGTSLPELATSLVAALKGESDIAIGNVIGSNIFNLLCILGIAPLIRPMTGASLELTDLGVLLLCSLLLLPMMLTGRRISRGEGGLLAAIYAAYTCYLLMRQG